MAYLLIGGVNFMLHHEPIIHFDIGLWIDDTEENLCRCSAAFAGLNAEWARQMQAGVSSQRNQRVGCRVRVSIASTAHTAQ